MYKYSIYPKYLDTIQFLPNLIIISVLDTVFFPSKKKKKNTDIFHISPQKNMLWYSLEVPHQGDSNEYPQYMFLWRNKKNIMQMPFLPEAMLILRQKKKKIEMCPQYTDAPAVGYLTIKLQNSTWYKCLKLSLTGSYSYRRTYICTHIRKTEKLSAPASSDAGA